MKDLIIVISCRIMIKFRENLCRLMEMRDLNQVQLSQRSGVSQSLISKHVRGESTAKTPSLKTLIALAYALRCTLEELTGLQSLRGIEEKIIRSKSGNLKLSDRAINLAKVYDRIPDPDAKELIEAMLFKAAEKLQNRSRKRGGDTK